jgi:hypothetical protein
MSTVQDQPQVGTNQRRPEMENRAAAPRVQEIRRSAEVVTAGFSSEAIIAAGAVVLTIIALSGLYPLILAGISTIVIGAALLMKSGSIAARFSRLRRETGDKPAVAVELGTGVSTELAAGAAGVALGVIALCGLVPVTLMAVATIVFGGGLLLGSPETYRVSLLGAKLGPATSDFTVRTIAKSMGAFESLVGVGGVVLGILALVGLVPLTLVLVGLLSLAGGQLLMGVIESGRMASILRW